MFKLKLQIKHPRFRPIFGQFHSFFIKGRIPCQGPNLNQFEPRESMGWPKYIKNISRIILSNQFPTAMLVATEGFGSDFIDFRPGSRGKTILTVWFSKLFKGFASGRTHLARTTRNYRIKSCLIGATDQNDCWFM